MTSSPANPARPPRPPEPRPPAELVGIEQQHGALGYRAGRKLGSFGGEVEPVIRPEAEAQLDREKRREALRLAGVAEEEATRLEQLALGPRTSQGEREQMLRHVETLRKDARRWRRIAVEDS